MKSSSATISTPVAGISLGPRGPVPLITLTLNICSPAVPNAPRNERLPTGRSPGSTVSLNTKAPFTSKKLSDALLVRSTSVNTAPKPLTVAGVVVPGMKNVTSVILLSMGVNSRCGLKVLKIVL